MDEETSGFHYTSPQYNLKGDVCIRKEMYAMSRFQVARPCSWQHILEPFFPFCYDAQVKKLAVCFSVRYVDLLALAECFHGSSRVPNKKCGEVRRTCCISADLGK